MVLVNWTDGRTEHLDMTQERDQARAFRISSDNQTQQDITGIGFKVAGRLQMTSTTKDWRNRKIWIEPVHNGVNVVASRIVLLLGNTEITQTHHHGNDMVSTKVRRAGSLRFDRRHYAVFGEGSG